MTSASHSDEDDSDEESSVPSEVLDGAEDIAEGRTADGDDLDESLGL